MDYDDNDFQSQNLHLAGEGSTKFPPALRPYPLPKFDFDESLQGHLRFDSLVETEVFLGIESNEDNQWIDAFSRGGSGIEFSSTAAESCSILRHGNVWSEATSSESVEMLLKSVGQEEFIPRQTVIQESDACDELSCLAKQMDPNPKPDDKNEFKDNVTDLQPPSGINENLSGVNEVVGMEQSQAGVSQGHEAELSIGGSSSNLELNDICRNVDMPVSEKSLFADDRSNMINQREVVTVTDDSHNDKTQDDSSASKVQTSTAQSLFMDDKSNNINQREAESVAHDSHDDKTQDESSASRVQTNITAASMQNMGDESQGSLQTQTNKQDLESSMMNKYAVVETLTLDGNAGGDDAHAPNRPTYSIPTEEALEGGSVVKALETGVSSFEGSLAIVSGGASDLQKAERCSEDMCSGDLSRDSANEDAIVLKDAVMNDQSALNTCDSPKVSIKDESSSEGQVAVVSNSSCGICPNLQQNVDIMEKNTYCESSVTKEKEILNSCDHIDTEILVSKSESSIFTVEDNNISTVSEGNDDRRGGCFSGFSVAASSTKSCILGESTQICEDDKPDRQVDHENIHQDVSVNDQESKKTPSDSSQMHYDIDQSHLVDKAVGSSSLNASSVETELTTSTLSTDAMPVNNSASQVISENISSISCEIIDVPALSSKVVSTQEVTDHIDFPRITPVGSAKMPEEAGISTPVGSSELETAPCPVMGTIKHHSSDTSRQLFCDTVSNCLQSLGSSGTEKIGEPQATLGDKVIRECTKEIGVPPGLCESTEKQGDDVMVSLVKGDTETVQKNNDNSSSKISGDILLASKGSKSSAPLPDSYVELHETVGFHAYPANNSCTPSITFEGPSQTEKDAEVMVPANQNPVSKFLNSGATEMLSTPHDTKGNDASKGERSFTSDVNLVADLSKKDVADLTPKDIGKRQSLPVTTADKASTVVERSSTSGVGPMKNKVAGNISHGSPQISDGAVARSISKGTPERKSRCASNKTAGKESSRKGSHVKETKLARQSEKGNKSNNVSLSPSSSFQLMQSNKVPQYGHIDSSSTKPFALLNASTSNLPDLNTSSPPVLFQQSFTDLQQVQLRAQIFVYGSLIQGTAPDEAYMISAFGGPDGGRSIWENSWRACMERQHVQKSHTTNLETPLQSRSGARASDLAVKQSALQGKGISSPLGRASSKATPTIVNPLIPLSSPLWSVPIPSCDTLQSSALARGSIVDYPQALTSLHAYQTPPVRNFLGHNTSWISQAPLRGPWIASPSPVPDNSSHLSTSPVSDTIKFSSAKVSLPPSSSIKNLTPGLPASSAGLQSIFVGTASVLDANNVTVSPAQHSSDPKPKKRKKVTVSEDLGEKVLQSQSQLVPTPSVSSRISTSVAIATPVVPITAVEKSVVSVSPLSLANRLESDRNVEKRILSDESLMKVKEARVHAEEASTLSAAAVNHSLEIWNQLDKQKNSGLVSDIEAKLASAAVAVAAAAAVAKAAAAAANVASNAAFQAKLMADEVLMLSGYENSSQSNKISLSEGTCNLGKATPASILNGGHGTNSPGSIIVAAKEAVRRRVEAASAATKRAENMDAIVKAAELAAEAVSQAGKIVTMGDPLPLSDLVEAGPEGCWKAVRESSYQIGLLKDVTRDLVNIDNGRNIPETSLTGNTESVEMGKQIATSKQSPFHKMHNERPGDPMKSIDGISISVNINEKNSRGPKGRKVSDLVNPIDVALGSETLKQASSFTVNNGPANFAVDNIKEGSLVEVFKDGEGFKASWLPANILSMKDGKAYVCYNSLVAVEGAGPLKEWVSLEVEGDKPPIIRITRPLTGLLYEGTRKRRRAAMGDYAWSVGDKVDAWIQDSWREGVITEQNKKDETTFTVYFPANEETSVVRAWHLRPSFIWKDGKWIESSKVGASDSSTREGDTPLEKRPKLGSPAVEVKGKEKMSESINVVESANPGELRLLNLGENERVFDIGKSSKNENKPDTNRMARTGLKKEGSRVIFGVPKPGKKRKFMEVSKHYVAHGSSKINDRNDSVKLANFLVPQGSGPRGWKNRSKNDTKEKLGADSKPNTYKSGKQPNVLGRAIPPKDNPLSNAFPLTEKIKGSSNHFKTASESENQVERASDSATDGAVEGPILFSSLATSTDAHSTKKTSTSRASKGKLAPAGGKLGKFEVGKALNDNPMKSTSEAIEPRRSNRRIQPTSRLLEGLQSSLIISKIPSVSHDKGHRNQNRNPSRGNNQG